jgi:hypothetical protein
VAFFNMLFNLEYYYYLEYFLQWNGFKVFCRDMVGWKPHVIFHICEKWDLKKKNVYDEVQLGRMQHYQPYDRSWKLEMNCMINGLIIWQICLKTWYVVQYVD